MSIAAQPAGVPEILKKSLHSCSVKGEEEVFLIGKNFLKGTKVIFQENVSGQCESNNLWERACWGLRRFIQSSCREQIDKLNQGH